MPVYRFGYSRSALFGTALAALVALTVCALPATAQVPVQLLTNGNFETGTFAGWSVANVRDASDTTNTRNFYIDTPGTTTPPVGVTSTTFSFATASNASGGSFYAVTTSDAPGQSALLQNFTTPNRLASVATLTFQLFANDQSGSAGVVNGAGLDYTTGGTFAPNQHARVDLLAVSATDFSTTVIRNFYLGADSSTTPATSPNPYTSYSFDISSNLAANTTYKLRFAEVDNLSAFNLGVDNVSLVYQPVPAPPAAVSLAIGGGVFALTGMIRTRARRRAQ